MVEVYRRAAVAMNPKPDRMMLPCLKTRKLWTVDLHATPDLPGAPSCSIPWSYGGRSKLYSAAHVRHRSRFSAKTPAATKARPPYLRQPIRII